MSESIQKALNDQSIKEEKELDAAYLADKQR